MRVTFLVILFGVDVGILVASSREDNLKRVPHDVHVRRRSLKKGIRIKSPVDGSGSDPERRLLNGSIDVLRTSDEWLHETRVRGI